jgi:hypothetical protein
MARRGDVEYDQLVTALEGQFYRRQQLVWADRTQLLKRHPWAGYCVVSSVFPNARDFFGEVLPFLTPMRCRVSTLMPFV